MSYSPHFSSWHDISSRPRTSFYIVLCLQVLQSDRGPQSLAQQLTTLISFSLRLSQAPVSVECLLSQNFGMSMRSGNEYLLPTYCFELRTTVPLLLVELQLLSVTTLLIQVDTSCCHLFFLILWLNLILILAFVCLHSRYLHGGSWWAFSNHLLPFLNLRSGTISVQYSGELKKRPLSCKDGRLPSYWFQIKLLQKWWELFVFLKGSLNLGTTFRL